MVGGRSSGGRKLLLLMLMLLMVVLRLGLLRLRLGRQTRDLLLLLRLLLLLLRRWRLVLMLLLELRLVHRSLVAPRVRVMEVGRRLGTDAAVARVLVVVGVVVVLMRSRLLDVVVRVAQQSVLADQVLHLALELVDALALRLDQALLVLDDGGELLQVQNGFHWIIQQALHH